MAIRQILCYGALAIMLSGCRPTSAEQQGVAPDTRVFMAEDLTHRQVGFIWIELPASLRVGSNEARVFIARTDPPGMLIPTETELPCILKSQEQYFDLRPVTTPLEYDGRQFVWSYTWGACASCVDCYMDWDTTIEASGRIENESLVLSLGIRHMGHNIREDYLQVELERQVPTANEPRILCRSPNDCRNVEFVARSAQSASPSANDLGSAERALLAFFDALSQGDYSQAAEYHWTPNPLASLYPDIDPADAEALLAEACTADERFGCHFYCWKVREVVSRTRLSPDEFAFVVQFEDADGNLLVGGDNVTPRACDPPGCTHSEYDYVVKKVAGDFYVNGIPVFVGCWP